MEEVSDPYQGLTKAPGALVASTACLTLRMNRSYDPSVCGDPLDGLSAKAMG